MPRYLVIRYDVTKLSDEERSALAMEAIVQGEASDDHPDVEAVEVCRFCGAPEDDGSPEVKDHCSGGPRACRERIAVEEFGVAISTLPREHAELVDVGRWIVRQYDGQMDLSPHVQRSLERAIREYYDLPFDATKTPHARRP